MKKLAAIMLAALLVLTACGNNSKPSEETAKIKIGTGVVTTEKATDAGEKDGSYQVDTYYATVVLEGDKIKAISIDVAQNKQAFNAEGALTTFAGKGTKKEQGDNYGMAQYSNPKAVAEWYKQMEEFEKFAVGQTVAELLAMKTKAKDDSHPAVPDVADLASKVTITVDKYLEAVEKASKNAVEVEGAVKYATSSTTSAKTDALEINTTIATVALDKDGKIVYSFLDAMQSQASFEGTTVKPSGVILTKGERKADYGMNWFEQRDTYVKWLAGKDKAGVSAAADIPSTVSISTDGFKAVVEKAIDAAVEIK